MYPIIITMKKYTEKESKLESNFLLPIKECILFPLLPTNKKIIITNKIIILHGSLTNSSIYILSLIFLISIYFKIIKRSSSI